MASQRTAGWLAILAALVGLGYSIAFVADSAFFTGQLLMLGGLLSAPVLIVLYRRVQAADVDFALWALLLVLFGAFGSMIHGGYDLANAIHAPEITDATSFTPEMADDLADLPSLSNQPFPVDPRGLLTFGCAGLGLGLLAWLAARTQALPRSLISLGYLLAALLIIIYLGRLIALDSDNPVLLVPALVTGLIVNPLFYLALGLNFLRHPGFAASNVSLARS